MELRVSDLYQKNGEINRAPYALWGIVLFLIKSQLDRLIAYRLYHRAWSFWSYIVPGETGSVSSLNRDDQAFYLTLLAIALPFICAGVLLTLRRLRAARLSPWLVVLFFAPIVNLLFFTLLCVIPTRDGSEHQPLFKRSMLECAIPKSGLGSAVAGVLATVVFSVIGTLIATELFQGYGWGLFIGLPFCLGLTTVLIYSYHERRSLTQCCGVALLALVFSGAGLLLFAVEGAVCLIMAAPIAIPLALLGAVVGYSLQQARVRNIDPVIVAVVLFMPSFMTAEHLNAVDPPNLQVASAVEIDAPPEVVWKHCVSFSPLPPPRELIFRAGIAYPLQARITGEGPGAVRHCVFSTGAFVEPIQIWDAPHLLRFTVTDNPPPMQEWTIYSAIHPAHLHGFLVSNGGQFLLTPLSGHRTRLEGTTWYRHSMWPVGYWRLWSDYIIHTIHMRVLTHLKAEAEAARE